MSLLYLDASAIVKLIVDEPESAALRAFIAGRDLLSCELVFVEVPRAIRRATTIDPVIPTDLLMERARQTMDGIALAPLDRSLLLAAGALAEPLLRSLDAIHIAAAIDLSPIEAFVSYDARQAAVARLAGLRTAAPGS